MLKLAYQRSMASPSMRLLDDVLDILGDATEDLEDPFSPDSEGSKGMAGAYMQRRNQATARLRSAFTGGAPDSIDIFAAAAALAEGGPLAAEELSCEYVRLYDFLGETTELLEQARERQKELGEAIERTQKELDLVQKRRPELLLSSDKALSEQARQLQLARNAYEDREQSIAQLDDVIFLARSTEVQIINNEF